MANTILEKLGIYDLIVIILSGLCITYLTLLVNTYFFSTTNQHTLFTENTILFFIISYVIGVIFQEISSYIHRHLFFKKDKLLWYSFYSDKLSEFCLTSDERMKILKSIKNVPPLLQNLQDSSSSQKLRKKEKANQRNHITYIYNYCKYHIASSNALSKADNNQAIAGLGRSLSLYFFVLAICFPFFYKNDSILVCIIAVLICILLALLLYYRCVRFTLIRYTSIFRSYYYDYVMQKQHNSKKKRKRLISGCTR